MKNTNVMGVILLICLAMVVCVTAGSYAPIVPNVGDGCGTLEISVMCHHNLFSKEMTIQRVDEANTLSFISGDRVSKQRFEQFVKVGDATPIALDPSGNFDERYAPGTYAIKLMDGNGGQPEYSIIKIVLGQKTFISFIGHAISAVSESEEQICVEKFTIVSALYGFEGTNCHNVTIIDVNATTLYSSRSFVNTSAYNVTVIDVYNHTEYQILTWQVVTPEVPAYTEFFGDYSKDGNKYVYAGVNKADFDVTFKYVAPDTGSFKVLDTKVFNENRHNVVKVKCTNHAEHGDGWHVQTSKCTESYVIHKEDYAADGDHFKYVGSNMGDYKVDCVKNVGHVTHSKVNAVYDWVVTHDFSDGTCGSSINCVDPKPKPGDTKCVERFVPDTFKEITIPATSNLTEWSPFSSEVCSPVDDFLCRSKDVPAQTHEETVCDNVGSMADVKSDVQKAVDGGHLSFLFDNGRNPGGLFDTECGLISEISDPAPGYVKTVTIVYNNGCDVQDKTVSAGEYVTITLGTPVITPS